MKKKDDITLKLLLAFILGIIVATVVIGIWNYLSFTRYPYGMTPNYMMMPMMNMMSRGGMMGTVGSVNCQATDAEFEELGEKVMEQMMGKELEERMESAMTNETSRMMHIAMGRMWSGC